MYVIQIHWVLVMKDKDLKLEDVKTPMVEYTHPNFCMYTMMRIIVETTHLVISQYAHDATNNGRVHTSTYTTIMSIYAHAFSVNPGEKKTIARRLS